MGGGISKHQDEVVTKPSMAAETSSSSVQKQQEQPQSSPPPPPAAEEESKCPMHRSDGSYGYDWRQLFKAAAVHGPQGSKPLSKEEQDKAKMASTGSGGGGGCPVKHNNDATGPTSSGCQV